MFVMIQGDYNFGVLNVVGPFETRSEARETVWYDGYRAYEVDGSDCLLSDVWQPYCTVRVEFDKAGKLVKVWGPFTPFADKHQLKDAHGLFRVNPPDEDDDDVCPDCDEYDGDCTCNDDVCDDCGELYDECICGDDCCEDCDCNAIAEAAEEAARVVEESVEKPLNLGVTIYVGQQWGA